MTKRLIDVVGSCLGLVFLLPLFAAVALAVKLDSRGSVFFRQERCGRGLQVFRIFKFRTMIEGSKGPVLTTGKDARVTRVGSYLRRKKIDELPQLINVLRGEMSLVGPRPEVPRFVQGKEEEFSRILTERPGMTDLASIEFSDEARILSAAEDPEALYLKEILPRKLALAERYLEEKTLLLDLRIILRTLKKLWQD